MNIKRVPIHRVVVANGDTVNLHHEVLLPRPQRSWWRTILFGPPPAAFRVIESEVAITRTLQADEMAIISGDVPYGTTTLIIGETLALVEKVPA